MLAHAPLAVEDVVAAHDLKHERALECILIDSLDGENLFKGNDTLHLALIKPEEEEGNPQEKEKEEEEEEKSVRNQALCYQRGEDK